MAEKKKKKNAAAMQAELRDLTRPSTDAPPKPPVDLKKIFIRVGLVLAVLWVAALFIPSWIAKAVAGVVTVLAIGAGIWVSRFLKRQQAIGALLHGAQNEEGRKDALKRIETEFKKDDVQAMMAKAQLEMQDDPRKALTTLENINLGKQLPPVADQVRSMRATIHLTFGELLPARQLVDGIEFGKQQEVKTRAMFATVAGEAWGRTGQAKKAIEMLELFNPEDPEYAEMKIQMYRARAFAYAGNNDMKSARHALKKLADMSPNLLGMFFNSKQIHPMLMQEAKQLFARSGAMPRKTVRQRM